LFLEKPSNMHLGLLKGQPYNISALQSVAPVGFVKYLGSPAETIKINCLRKPFFFVMLVLQLTVEFRYVELVDE
jgi:hypothetical protein